MPESEVKITGDVRGYEAAMTKAEERGARWASSLQGGARAASEAIERLAQSNSRLAAEQAKAAEQAAKAAREQLKFLDQWKAADEKAARAMARGAAFDASAAKAGIASVDAAASKLSQTMASAAGPAKALLGKLGEMGLAAVGIGQLSGALGAAVSAVDKLAADSLVAQRASANLEFGISKAAEAFGGYVDNISLAKAANKAFAMDVAKDSDEFARIARGVNVIAQRLGEDQTVLLDNAITAIGRQSRLILDNLGIILDQAKAERVWAKELGVTVDQLDAYNKSIAFSKAATILISQAADDAAVSVDGMAAKFAQGKVALENFRAGVLGFDESIGQTREALRRLTDEELERLSFADFADDTSKIGKEVNGYLEQWGATLDDVDKLARELGITFDELIEREEKRRQATAATQERKVFEENKKARLAGWEAEADAIEHDIELRRIVGVQEKDLVDLQVKQLQLRLNAAEAAGDLVKTLELQRQIEKTQLEASVAKPAAKGASGPTAAERAAAAGAIRIAQIEDEIELLEQRAELADTTERDAEMLASRRLGLRMVELDVERETLLVTKAKNSVEREANAARIEAIERERQLAIGEANIEAIQRAAAEEVAAIEQRIAGLDREIERASALGVEVGLLRELRQRAHDELLAQMGDAEAIAESEHQKQIAEIEARNEAHVARQQAELDAHVGRMEMLEAEGFAVDDLFERRVELELRVAKAEGDHDKVRQILHQADLGRIRMRQQAEQRALQATSQSLGIANDFATTIINSAIKNDAKRERAALRMSGIMAIARAAVETVEAAASFARYDFVGGALHTAAAVLGYVQGGIMLAGRVPAQGGGSAGSASAPTGGSDRFSDSFSDRQKDPPPVPLSTDLDDTRGGGRSKSKPADKSSGGTVINIHGPVITSDSSYMLEQVDKKKAASWGN